MKRLWTIALFCLVLCSCLGLQPLAAPDWQEQRELEAIKRLFSDLQQAYRAENIELFLRCYDTVVASTDVPRKTFAIMTEEIMRQELPALFAWLDNINMEFLDLEILVERDTAMVRTMRRGVATGFPAIIHCRMIFTLRKNGCGWGNQNWRIAADTILTEEYIYEGYVDPATGLRGAPAPAVKSERRERSMPQFF